MVAVRTCYHVRIVDFQDYRNVNFQDFDMIFQRPFHSARENMTIYSGQEMCVAAQFFLCLLILLVYWHRSDGVEAFDKGGTIRAVRQSSGERLKRKKSLN